YHVQDVTASNEEYLRGVADEVHICDTSKIEGTYDIVFSTYVLEHVCTPKPFLEEMSRLLKPGGMHLLACPRHGFPGYLCPSLRHLPLSTRLWALCFLPTSRIVSWALRSPKFWVNTSPSVFHGPWYRDADCVHLVSRFDVEYWHRTHGFKVERIPPPKALSWQDYIVKNYLVTLLASTKDGG
ncbi:methyltransferase domain-containing protein, partial [bacterium AH-315-F18]|nr:methyltransferase domain-containing protein [bacterium AH-315-F18]